MLSHFRFALFRLCLTPAELVVLPFFKGSVFRGALGSALKKVACVFRDRECEGCQLEENCVYRKIFETPKPADDSYFRGMVKIPHPFVLEPPQEEKQAYEPDDNITFHLILIGHAMKHWPFFVYAFSELGQSGIGKHIESKRGRCKLNTVESLPSLNAKKGEILYTHDSQEISGGYMPVGLTEVLRGRPEQLNEITLEFLTPTRIQEYGDLQQKLTFATLLKRLLQRISMLSYFHCGKRLDIDYRTLIEQAEREIEVASESLEWFALRRYSRRQEQSVSLGGFLGNITFEGNLQDYLPFIYLGEYLHVGKNTAFGLGKYRVFAD